MSLLSENVFLGNHRKIFGTNAKKGQDLEKIKHKVLSIGVIKHVIINIKTYSKKFTINTSKLFSVKDIENVVIYNGFHAIPKNVF